MSSLAVAAIALLASAPSYHRPAVPERCAAVRGNGELVMSHFSSLARIVEDQGVLDGLAGGSSASISMFIYESMLSNPAVWSGKPEEAALRLSFLLKSMQEYVDIVASTDEAKALTGLGQQLLGDAQAGNLQKLLAGPPGQLDGAIGQVKSAVMAANAQGLLNKDAIKFLELPGTPKERAFRANELVLALKTFGKFEASDKLIFFRPGIIDFKEVAARISKVGSVYAGQGADPAAWKKLLDTCAPGTKGLRWSEIKAKNPGCAAQAHGLLAGARAKSPMGRGSAGVGSVAHVLVATSVLEAKERKLWEAGLARYTKGDNLASFVFHPFQNLKIGYFGAADDLGKVKANPKSFGDPKTRKRLALGQVSWATALSLSPAEPGLSRGNAIPNSSNLSLGGWPDLAPVLALKNLGCKAVFYVTRQGDESPFAQGVAKNLGMSDAEQKTFYDLGSQTSAFSQSLKQADAVHCTNWNAFKANQREPMDADAFNAPLFTHNADIAKHHAGGSTSGGGPTGCTK